MNWATLEGIERVLPHGRLPVVLTRGETAGILGRLEDPTRLVCELQYGGSLRLLEALTLRVKDIEEVRGEIRLLTVGGRDKTTKTNQKIGPRSRRAPHRARMMTSAASKV